MNYAVDDILLRLRNAKARVFVEGQQLKIDVESGMIDEELKNLIRQHKTELVAVITHAKQHTPGSIPPIPRDQKYYPLSSAQRRIWVLSQFPDSEAAYNMGGAHLLTGVVDPGLFSQAFAGLVSRHEILRTVFREDETGEIAQCVLPVQVTLTTGELAEADAATVVRGYFNHPFDLAEGPLLQAGLYQLGEERWLFCYCMHHIISDGWSVNVMIRELLTRYQALLEKKTSPLPIPEFQYIDFAAWQQQQLKGTGMHASRSYWEQQLGGILPVLAFPADHERPALQTFNGGIHGWMLAPQAAQWLQQYSREQGTTLFTGLLSLVYLLLYRYTHQEDMIIGTPAAGRQQAGLDTQIGCYINTLALRARIDGNHGFRELLQQVKQVVLGAQDHQAYPFDELITLLNIRRDASRNPFFDVMVSLDNKADVLDGFSTGTFNIAPFPWKENEVSKFDFSFSFIERDAALQASIEFNTDIYERETVVRLAGCFNQLLDAVIADATMPLRQLPMVSVDLNQTENYPVGTTVISLFEEQVRLHPAQIAVNDETQQLDYHTLNNYANQVAAGLREKYNIQPGDLVGIMLERSHLVPVAVLGVLKAGAAYVPIATDYPQDRISYIIADSKSKVVLDQSMLRQLIDPKQDVGNTILPDGLAYVIYTSGSTGKPKGVMVDHHALAARIAAETIMFPRAKPLISCLCTSFVFDVSLLELFLPLANGGRIIIPPPSLDLLSIEFLYFLDQHEVNILQGTPGFMQQMLHSMQRSGKQPNKLAYLCIGGESLPAGLFAGLKELLPACCISNHYGPTETTIDALVNYDIQTFEKNVIGKPLAYTHVLILDPGGQVCPVGVYGEICIGGDGLAKGYLNQQELTAAKFIQRVGQRLYRSGDTGRWLSDGSIEFVGRTDDQLKVRGYRIEPGEIESVLCSIPDISAAVVLPVGEGNEKELWAYLLSTATLDMQALTNALRNALPAYMVPARFIQLAEFPLTQNGKTDKALLPQMNGVTLETGLQYEGARTATEEKLVHIWSMILGRSKDRIGVEHSFFEMGGHSLIATRIVTAMRTTVDPGFSMKDIFIHSTIRKLAAVIDERLQAGKVRDQDAGSWPSFEELVSPLPADAEPVYPIAHSQEKEYMRYLVIGPFAYNMLFFVTFSNPDKDALKKTVYALIARHESLRTTYLQRDGVPLQYIHPEVPGGFRIEHVDITGVEDKEAAIEELRRAGATLYFDLERGPSLSVKIVDYTPVMSGLFFVIPHVNTDAVSVAILRKEIAVLYDAFRTGQTPDLPPATWHFKDYGLWVNAFLDSARGIAIKERYAAKVMNSIQQEYLAKGKLYQAQPEDTYRAGLTRELQHFMPDGNHLQYPRVFGTLVNLLCPPASSYTTFIKPEIWQRVKQLAMAADTSVFNTVLTLFAIAHAKVEGKRHIRVIVPYGSRILPEFENITGWTTPALLLCLEVDPQAPLKNTIGHVKETALEMSLYCLYPHEKLLEVLDVPLNVMVPLMVNYISLPGAKVEDFTPYDLSSGDFVPFHRTSGLTSHYHIKHIVDEYDNGTMLVTEYKTGLYTPAQIEVLVKELHTIMENITLS